MRKVGFVFLSCLLFAAAALAGGKSEKSEASTSYLKQAKFVEGHIVSLAKAIPQEKYNWRPMKGVRSVSEAFMHVAVGNYVILQTLGGKPPASFNNKFESSVTDKDKVVTEVQNSFSAVNDFIQNIPESEYSQTVKFFGMDMTKLDMIFLAATHAHETLGQAIAYARMNKVVPPWTEAQQAREKGKM